MHCYLKQCQKIKVLSPTFLKIVCPFLMYVLSVWKWFPQHFSKLYVPLLCMYCLYRRPGHSCCRIWMACFDQVYLNIVTPLSKNVLQVPEVGWRCDWGFLFGLCQIWTVISQIFVASIFFKYSSVFQSLQFITQFIVCSEIQFRVNFCMAEFS